MSEFTERRQIELLAEILETDRQILAYLKSVWLPLTYPMSVNFEGETSKQMSTTPPAVPTDNTTVGQITIGFPVEQVTNPNTGVTGPYAFIPADIVWVNADPTIATVTLDPTTGDGKFTPLAAGTTTGTVTDSDTGGTIGYDVVVAAATLPNTYSMTVTFQPAPVTPTPTPTPAPVPTT